LHALDRISDANIVCVVSFHESQPTVVNPLATVHEYISRSIVRRTRDNSKLTELSTSFRELVAQPSVDHLTAIMRGEPLETASGLPPQIDDESNLEVDELVRSFDITAISTPPSQAAAQSTNNEPNPASDDTNWFASPNLESTTGSQITTAAAAFDFGKVVEEALTTLNMSELDSIKVKLISVSAKEEFWPGMLREIGLSSDAASMLSLILKLHSTRIV
jgi:hypothetical protein